MYEEEKKRIYAHKEMLMRHGGTSASYVRHISMTWYSHWNAILQYRTRWHGVDAKMYWGTAHWTEIQFWHIHHPVTSHQHFISIEFIQRNPICPLTSIVSLHYWYECNFFTIKSLPPSSVKLLSCIEQPLRHHISTWIFRIFASMNFRFCVNCVIVCVCVCECFVCFNSKCLYFHCCARWLNEHHVTLVLMHTVNTSNRNLEQCRSILCICVRFRILFRTTSFSTT